MKPVINALSSRQHVYAEIDRIDSLIRAQVWRARQAPVLTDDLRPYYISEQEVDSLLERTPGMPPWAVVPLPDEMRQDLQDGLDRMETAIASRKEIGRQQGVIYRLDELARLFQLTPFDQDVVLFCLAPQVDLRFERLYAYLQDDASRPSPTVGLLLNLLCPDLEAESTARLRLNAQAPLRRFHLIHYLPAPAWQAPLFPAQTLRLDDRIRRYLLDDDEPDEMLLPFVELIRPGIGSKDRTPATLQARLERAACQEPRQMFYFQGSHGVGRQAAAEALAYDLHCRLLVLDGQGLAETAPEIFSELAQRAGREASLQGAILFWRDFDALLTEECKSHWQVARPLLSSSADLAILAGEMAWEPGQSFGARPFLCVPFSLPDAAERARLWALSLDGVVEDAGLQAIASQFRLSAGQISAAAATACSLARWRDPDHGQVTLADLVAASRRHSNQKLASLAQKITPHYTWADLVLPPEVLDLLRQLCDQVRYRSQVLEDWGFGRKLPLGKGVHALFTGPPGTGKTMAADILAGELDLDLYKIDLSTVMSKYIGETEKNLARIFAEAATSNAILFFDEADALFGKRTEVKDAHDRYANLEVSYLLQKMDEYDGLVILATNLRQNLDKAFLRRLNFIVEFPFPNPADRLRIWQGVWPADAPRDPDLDLPVLAKELEVAGGSIRNIALSAAYLAAAQDEPIRMTHLRRAAESEYRKIGKFTGQS